MSSIRHTSTPSSPTQSAAALREESRNSLIQRGKIAINQHNFDEAHAYFEEAASLDLLSAELTRECGALFLNSAKESGKRRPLTLACRWLKRASSLAPTDGTNWWLLATALSRRQEGNIDEAFAMARRFAGEEERPHIERDYASFLLSRADQSGEYSDLTAAITACRDIAEHYESQCNTEFWIAYGKALYQAGRYATLPDSILEAATCFRRALADSIASQSAWHSLASALASLADYTHDPHHYEQALQCFGATAQLAPRNATLLIEWAHTAYKAGLFLSKEAYLVQAIEKGKKARALSKKASRKSRAVCSMALAELGHMQGRLSAIREAEDEIDRLLETSDGDATLWHAYGTVLLCSAAYYNDLDTCYQAIHAFQTGLSLDRSNPELWVGIGLATKRAARLENDQKLTRRAVRFFKKALDLHITPWHHFLYGSTLASLEEGKAVLYSGLTHMEKAIAAHPHTAYIHPEWLFECGIASDSYGTLADSEAHYARALDLFTHVLHVDPTYPDVHYYLALVYAHYGDFLADRTLIETSLHHFASAYARDAEADYVILDWATTLINLADLFPHNPLSPELYAEAEYKLIQAAKLGNVHAWYTLACLCALTKRPEQSLTFLKKSHGQGVLPPLDEVQNDDWLETLQTHPPFLAFLKSIE